MKISDQTLTVRILDLPEVKAAIAEVTERAERAEAELERLREHGCFPRLKLGAGAVHLSTPEEQEEAQRKFAAIIKAGIDALATTEQETPHDR